MVRIANRNKTHQELVGRARASLEKEGWIIVHGGPVKGFNPDLYALKYSRRETLTAEVMVEVEVTEDDLWKPHTEDQLRTACRYCSSSDKSRRTTLLVVPRGVAGNAEWMLKLRRFRGVTVRSY